MKPEMNRNESTAKFYTNTWPNFSSHFAKIWTKWIDPVFKK